MKDCFDRRYTMFVNDDTSRMRNAHFKDLTQRTKVILARCGVALALRGQDHMVEDRMAMVGLARLFGLASRDVRPSAPLVKSRTRTRRKAYKVGYPMMSFDDQRLAIDEVADVVDNRIFDRVS